MGNFLTVGMDWFDAQNEWCSSLAATYFTKIPAGTPESRAKMWCDQYQLGTFSNGLNAAESIRAEANDRYEAINQNLHAVCQIFMEMGYKKEELPYVIETLTEYKPSATSEKLYHDLYTSWKNYKAMENFTDNMSIVSRTAYLTQFKTTFAKFVPHVDKNGLLDTLAVREENKYNSEVVATMLNAAGVSTNSGIENKPAEIAAITFHDETQCKQTPKGQHKKKRQAAHIMS